jgi:hypothetical protein
VSTVVALPGVTAKCRNCGAPGQPEVCTYCSRPRDFKGEPFTRGVCVRFSSGPRPEGMTPAQAAPTPVRPPPTTMPGPGRPESR